MVREFGGHSGSELELQSMIHFIDCDLGGSGQASGAAIVATRVPAIKPHFSSAVTEDRIEAMRGRGFLGCDIGSGDTRRDELAAV